MKKIILVLAALAVTTVSAFAGPAISVGGGVGSYIMQGGGNESLRVEASPVVSAKVDLQWEKLGVAADFDFQINYLNSPWHWDNDLGAGGALWDSDTRLAECLYITPYANLNAGDFNFNIGPTVGIRIEQNKAKYTEGINVWESTGTTTAIAFGGTVNCNYKITEKLNAYLELPLLCHGFFLSCKGTSSFNGAVTNNTNTGAFVHNIDVYVTPKMGLSFTF